LIIRAIIWLDEILEKVQRKHHVSADEVRAILVGRAQFRFVEKGHRRGEDLYSAASRTGAGRYLVVLFVYRRDKAAVVVTAREMTPTERRLYAKS
jgi:uncharacterized protein